MNSEQTPAGHGSSVTAVFLCYRNDTVQSSKASQRWYCVVSSLSNACITLWLFRKGLRGLNTQQSSGDLLRK